MVTGRDCKRTANQVHSLEIARIVEGAAAAGMLVTQIVLAVAGLIMLVVTGKSDILRSFATVLPVTAAFVACGWAAIRWIDRRITDRVRAVNSPEMCLPLLEIMGNGLPLG